MPPNAHACALMIHGSHSRVLLASKPLSLLTMNAMFRNLQKDVFARIEKTQSESRVLPKLFGDLIHGAETVLMTVGDMNDVQFLAHRADKIHNMYIFGKKFLCIRNSHTTSDVYINLSYNKVKCEDVEDAIAFLAMLMYTGRMTARDLKVWTASIGIAPRTLGYDAEFFRSSKTFSDSISLLPEKADHSMAL